jgi:hypothetical protein
VLAPPLRRFLTHEHWRLRARSITAQPSSRRLSFDLMLNSALERGRFLRHVKQEDDCLGHVELELGVKD